MLSGEQQLAIEAYRRLSAVRLTRPRRKHELL